MVAHHDNLSDLLKPELSQISIGLLHLHSFNHLRFSGFQFYNMLTQGLFHFISNAFNAFPHLNSANFAAMLWTNS